MKSVTEIVDAYPENETLMHIERDEKLLFAKPGPPVSKFLQDYPLLEVIHFDSEYSTSAFAPPRDVYSSEHVRIEWQKMNQRQPFYHRNADVDEISFHICGKRTLMSERGSVDLHPGDFARIPVFTAHDNYGIEDVHLIFYLTAPAEEQARPSRQTEFKIPPFPNWSPKQITEVITECLGTPGCDRAHSLVDENMILNAASNSKIAPINVINAYEASSASSETQWLYKSKLVWLGSTTLRETDGETYRRHRRADEIQCQIKGSRTLITQRGSVVLEPGDFVSIPLGTAFTSVPKGESTHLSVLTRIPAEPKAVIDRTAEETNGNSVKN